MKNLLRYIGGGILALLIFCNVPVYQGHTALFEMRVAEAAVNPAWVRNIGSVAELTGKDWSNYPYLNLTSYVAGKNKGGGLLYLATTGNASTMNFCTVLVDGGGNGFFREQAGAFYSSQCGALGDNTADDTLPLQHGLNTIENGPVVNTIQGATGGEFVVDPGTFRVTTSLNYGGSGLINNGMIFRGSGRGSTVLFMPSGSGCVINDYTFDASSTLSDMFLVNNGGAGSCGVDVRGNGQTIERLWLDALAGIQFDGASDVQVSNILCDQCNASVLNFVATVGIASNINVQGVEAFGGTTQTFANGIGCVGAHHDIVISGFITNFLAGDSIIMSGGCQMTVDAYNLNSSNNTAAGAPATQYGITASGSGTKLTLGTGVITGMQAAGIQIDSGATVIDSGATIFNNVNSASATDLAEISITNANYYKTGGSIAGGTGHETELVHIIGNNAGRLSLVGVPMQNSAGGAVLVQNGGGGSVNFAQIKDCDILNTNTANSVTNTPIAIGATRLAIVSGNNIAPTNAVTAAIAFNSGTNGIFTYNAASSGTFPANAGTSYSVGNVNY